MRRRHQDPGLPNTRLQRVLITAGLLLIAGGGCQGWRYDPHHPDLVLVVIDTLRADHLGAYGYGRPTSPHIDALAARGARFDSAWAAAPWTLPSIMSIQTSRYPSSHRVENDGLKLAPDIPTLAATLRAAGYATAGFVSHIYASRLFGFDRGFERFDDFGVSQPGYRLEAGLEPRADRVVDAALAWLRAQGHRPVFLFVHLFDPHWPYDPPASYRALFPDDYRGPLDATYDSISKFQDPLVPLPEDYRSFLVDRYDGEIRFTDDQVGRLLQGVDRSGREGRAWIVLTADHGEEFKEHGSMGHGRALYEEVIHVPLIVAAPGDRPSRIDTPVSGIDLFPTLAAIAGAAPPPGLQGRSLLPLLRPTEGPGGAPGGTGSPPPPAADRPLVSETVRLNAYRKAVREGPLKLIRFMGENRTELYDLASDPQERHDLSERRPAARQMLLRALFAQVDLLSGGWNLAWSGDGRPRRFQGQIRTDGIFRTIVPLFHERGKYILERGDTLNFTDAGQSAESGLSFTTAPADASVTFYLLIDGRPLLERVVLGGRRARPREMPFTLEGLPSDAAAFERPPHAEGTELGFYLWRNRPAGPEQEIVLDDEIRERLRSLGYVQ
jgi:arylsulfatase A-like enzyme